MDGDTARLAMSPGDHCWVIPKVLQAHSLGIVYPALLVICIVGLARLIRRRRQGQCGLPMSEMDSRSLRQEKYDCEQQTKELQQSTPSSNAPSHRSFPLPSACDILQPLSQLAPLPSSGYLASILGCQPSRSRLASEEDGQLQQSSALAGSESRAVSQGNVSDRDEYCPATSDRNAGLVGSFTSACSKIENEDQRRDEASTVPAARSVESHRQEVYELAGSEELHPPERRNQTVHFPQVVDAEGTRSWRRVIVEYS
ncbi:uncharacterized protein P174DRAFT_503850 [Aspergillus novofumigatus IBT 16806]|uniref:Uncharacterized protein n=1 Tax=Aspergillus novofumigatus (strain IBT 16806) TaxID=1392255 RepID=A0A2I1C8V5_ASPN1|nr:uncharacterized protein P174DRAFT_503850 [Aspergillus novofumigatus IBT 16806]PKX94053.1 hypothetical protein P174DRAFT_503850 [Aspergillus novofumigatus IBT 16806]